MAAYIEREAIKYELWSVGPLNEPMMVVRKKTIDRIPAADVAPVRHGKWVKQEDYSCCSECGQPIVDDCIPWFKFCANCGAKMDGGGE